MCKVASARSCLERPPSVSDRKQGGGVKVEGCEAGGMLRMKSARMAFWANCPSEVTRTQSLHRPGFKAQGVPYLSYAVVSPLVRLRVAPRSQWAHACRASSLLNGAAAARCDVMVSELSYAMGIGYGSRLPHVMWR